MAEFKIIVKFENPFAQRDSFISCFVGKAIIHSKDMEKIYGSEARNSHRDSQENLAKPNRRREGLGVDKMDNQLGVPHYREILNTMEKSLI